MRMQYFLNPVTKSENKLPLAIIPMASRQKLDTMIGAAMNIRSSSYEFSVSDAVWLCQTVQPILKAEPTLLEFAGPVNICGDIHGQFTDLVRAIQMGGLPPFAKWLFLGDYVDRGPQSVECICLLFALKIRYPSQVFLIRGNHETPEMTEVFGFAEECLRKLNGTIWQTFCDVFEYMPLGAVISGQYFCVHGGISPELETLQQIREIKRPLAIPISGMITDLLWSDPCAEVVEYGQSTRGSTVLWGIEPAKRFLSKNRLKYIVRGHQVAMEGYDYPFPGSKAVVTMFTASNYTPDCSNKAAFMAIDQSGKNEIKVLPSLLSMSMPLSRDALKPRLRTGLRLNLSAVGSAPPAPPAPPTARPRSSAGGKVPSMRAGIRSSVPIMAATERERPKTGHRQRRNSLGLGTRISIC